MTPENDTIRFRSGKLTFVLRDGETVELVHAPNKPSEQKAIAMAQDIQAEVSRYRNSYTHMAAEWYLQQAAGSLGIPYEVIEVIPGEDDDLPDGAIS